MSLDPQEREYRAKYREPKESVDRIDDLRKKLYSRVDPVKRNNFRPLKQNLPNVNESWAKEEQKPDPKPKSPKYNKFVWFFILAILGCLAALVYAGVVWFTRPPQISPDNVDIQTIGPVTVDGGDPFSVQIVVSNNNAVDLELADLIVEFPEGAKTSDGQELKRSTFSLGTIRPGEIVKRDIEMILYGNEKTTQTMNTRLLYNVAGSVSIYEKAKPTTIALGESPLVVLVNMTSETVSGQRFNIDIDVTSNSKAPTDNIILSVDYPFGFNFLESSLTPMVGTNNVFEFERLQPGEVGKVRITGVMSGSDGDIRAFRFATGIKDPSKPTSFSTLFATDIKDVVLTKPFIGSEFQFRDHADRLVVDPNGAVNGVIKLINNTSTQITNASVQMKLDSPVLDRTSVDPSSGFYRSVDNTIIWDSTTNNRLASIAPGESFDLNFLFNTKPLVDGVTLFKNPEIILTTDIKGRRVSENNVPEDLERTIVTNVKVNSQVDLKSYAVYSIGPFENTGPFPPRAEQETTYTINWELSNTSNTIDNVVMRALLPNYMTWKNLAVPDNSGLSFDSANRIITWNIGSVESGVGHGRSAKSVSFQVGLFPSLSQVSTAPELVRDISLSYKDRFTGEEISEGFAPIDTGVDNDPAYNFMFDQVTP